MRTRYALALAAIAGSILVAPLAHADQRATTVDAPDGNRYYIYAYGRDFPFGHGLQVWEETNGITGKACGGINEALPVGHVTDPTGVSDLQIADGVCKGKHYKADTFIAGTPQVSPPIGAQ